MQILKAVVEPLLEQALTQVGITNEHWRSMLAPSRELDQGDLSLPCFPFAKQLGKAPPAIAEAVAEAMAPHEAVGEVNAVGGYPHHPARSAHLGCSFIATKRARAGCKHQVKGHAKKCPGSH